MAKIKRVVKKLGSFGRSTTTYSSKGVTRSTSNKPPGKFSTRRTVSFKNGKARTTYSNKLGGGWTNIVSKTTGGSTRRKSGGRSRGGSVDASGLLTLPIVIFLGIAIMIMYTWPVTIPYIVGAVLGLVIVGVILNLLFMALPWIILGAILYGLYSFIKLF